VDHGTGRLSRCIVVTRGGGEEGLGGGRSVNRAGRPVRRRWPTAPAAGNGHGRALAVCEREQKLNFEAEADEPARLVGMADSRAAGFLCHTRLAAAGVWRRHGVLGAGLLACWWAVAWRVCLHHGKANRAGRGTEPLGCPWHAARHTAHWRRGAAPLRVHDVKAGTRAGGTGARAHRRVGRRPAPARVLHAAHRTPHAADLRAGLSPSMHPVGVPVRPRQASLLWRALDHVHHDGELWLPERRVIGGQRRCAHPSPPCCHARG